MRHPPPCFRVLVFPTRILVSTRQNSSVGALCVVESIVEASLQLQENFHNFPKDLSSQSSSTLSGPSKLCSADSREMIEKDVVMLGEEESEFIVRKGKLRRYSSTLHICALERFLNEGKAVHGQLIKSGIDPDSYSWNSLANFYAKCGSHRCARQVLHEMPKRDVVTWTALIAGLIDDGYNRDGGLLFSDMRNDGVRPNGFTLTTAFKGCSMCLDIDFGEQLHTEIIKIGFFSDIFVGSCLVDFYAKCGEMKLANRVLLSMLGWNLVSWSALLNGHTQIGEGEEILKMFFKSGFESDKFINNALVVMYMKLGSVQEGWLLFDTIIDRDLASWNALLSGYDNDETCDQGPRIFKQMLVEGFKPDMYTFCSILRHSICLSNVKFGKQVHAHSVKSGLSGDSSIGTALINMYSNNRCLEDVGIIFHRFHKKDLLTWTVIIASYVQNDESDKAVKCFSQMQHEGLKPNEFTLSSCLSGCSNLANLDTGRQFHSLAVKLGMSKDTYAASALVDMYVKCRSIEDAEALFKDMVERKIVSWNTIVCGYAQIGKGEKALEAFQLMLDEGFVPDEITFIGLLSACSNMGLVEEGKNHFNSLETVYGITPTIEHHACMVNILCRAGRFHEVGNFIEETKLAQNAMIWETVLWGSKIHGNMEFGQKAAERLFELEPEMHYNYIMLSDIFAAKGRWDDVAKVRALMLSQGIKKEPGCSWVKINGQAHMFFAQDGSDPKINEICLRLGKLTR
ncbi:hypothetical protein U1Q18_028705 [Sarracenia purpurea var. burkii]